MIKAEDFQTQIAAVKTLLTTHGVTFLENLALALVIFVSGRWLAKLAANQVARLLQRSKTDQTLVGFLRTVMYGFSVLFVGVAALDRLGVNTTSFAAAIAAAGLAVGLALQGSLSNFAAGVMIILFRYFRVGDRIEVGGQQGVVQEIEMLYSLLVTDDKVRVIIPNSLMTAGVVKVFPRPA